MKKDIKKIKKVKKPRGFGAELKKTIKENKVSFVVYSVLRVLVLCVLVRSIFLGNYENAMICLLSLVLFLIPPFIEKKLNVELPTALECIIFLFIFSAEILGEINCYYIKISGWDTMLHTINGFLFAAVGFALVDLLNRNAKNINLSPLYLSLVAFCFSMTVGVLWEFFEFGMDKFFALDMQKDTVVTSFSSVTFDESNSNIPIKVNDIVSTVITTQSGEQYTVDGYLDIGIRDTMKDLWVNFIGAVTFGIIGYFYVKNRDKKSIARYFIPKVKKNDEICDTNDE